MPAGVDPLSCCGPSRPDHRADARRSAPADGSPLGELRREETPADVARLRNAAFRQLFETGDPVSEADLVTATGIDAARSTEILESIRARGRIEFDAAGTVIGIAGLSLTPSRHAFAIEERTRWTWCALDAVGIMGALGADGTVTSTDPQTGEIVVIDFVDGRPETDAHLFIPGGFAEGNVREAWCPRVNFFTTIAAAEAWAADIGLGGETVAVADIAADAAALWGPVVDQDAT